MVFSSLLFLFLYLPLFLGIYFLTPKSWRNGILFLASLLFYAWGEPIYVSIMLFSTVFDYSMGLLIHHFRDDTPKAKIALLFSIITNLSLLGFFKYSDFFLSSVNGLFNLEFDLLQLALPIGISFYTFQTMSYTIDVYRGRAEVQRNIVAFGAYVSMFPQLIAGPIVTYRTVQHELTSRKENLSQFADGIVRFIEGLGKKVLLANNLGLLWETVKDTPSSDFSILLLWLGIIAFGLQLYFDFSGYSDMAIGLGKMLGFTFPENFNYPYIAKSATEFWRRWHITLGNWFRDYVYIPLGGNRVSKSRWYINILTVWFLTGFWHGAGWNFILWGLFFSVLLILEKHILLQLLQKVPTFVSHLYLIVAVLISWVLFSIEDLSLGFRYLQGMFGFQSLPFFTNTALFLSLNFSIFIILGCLFATPVMNNLKHRLPVSIQFVVYGVILVISTAYLVDSTFNPFLYFRF